MKNEFWALLEAHRGEKILVTSHRDPDGDGVGAILACAYILRDLGFQTFPYNRDIIPDRYSFLDTRSLYRARPNWTEMDCRVAIVLDAGSPDRLGFDLRKAFPEIRTTVNIDHHVSNRHYGDLNIVFDDRSSTCEILFDLFADGPGQIGPEVANALYAGIVTDTGGFQYEATTPQTLRTAASLLEMGADINQVREQIYESESYGRMVALSRVLQGLRRSPDGRIAWIRIDHEDLLRFQLAQEELEAFVDYPRMLAGVETALCFKEVEKGFTKVSVRTKGSVDANRLAAAFGGGGHRRAAGFKMHAPISDIEETVLARMQEILQQGD